MKKHSERFYLNYSQRGLDALPSNLLSSGLVTPNQIDVDLAGNCLDQEQAALFKLTLVKSLNLALNHIQVLYPLPSSLEILNLSCNHLKDLKMLNALNRLKHLDISCNLVSDLTPLQGLKSLRTLLVAFNLIKDLNSLEFFMQIVDVDFEHNKVDSLDSVQGLLRKNVIVFICKNNPIAE